MSVPSAVPGAAGPAIDPLLAPVPAEPTVEPPNPAPMPKMRALSIWSLVLLTLGGTMAVVVPMSYSLTVRLAVLAPGQEAILGYIVGIGALFNVLTMPIVGVLSDRTKTRIGRRRPWAIGGMLVGVGGLFALATVQSVFLLGAFWALTICAWQTAGNQATYTQGDKLPEEQRGRVAALSGFASLAASVIGMSLATPFASNTVLLFLVPGIIGVIGTFAFVLTIHEDSRGFDLPKVKISEVLQNFVFNPRKHPDYGWNWAGRFVLFFGLSFTSTYGTYFMGSRLGISLTDLAGIVALAGIGGVIASAAGALGSGFLSDKLKRRKPFVALAAVLGLVGSVLSATAYSLPQVLTGSILTMLAVGIFSTVDQAIFLDTLPDRSESGRYIAIIGLAQQIPTALGPFVAPILLGIGVAAGASPNYTLLFSVAGALFLVGGMIIVTKIRGVR